MDTSLFKSAIHTISSVLEIPAIIVLLAVTVIVIYQLGSLLVEFFAERVGRRLNVTRILEDLAHNKKEQYLTIIGGSNFQKKQKESFRHLLESRNLDDEEKRLFATQIVTDEETRLEKRVAVTDVIARIAPMFGLMATLIPLGPGLIALGQGDTKGLADSLLTAFDATVAGLVSAGVAFIISKIRKRWYLADISAMETILEEVIH